MTTISCFYPSILYFDIVTNDLILVKVLLYVQNWMVM
jgi:hypothetical protein